MVPFTANIQAALAADEINAFYLMHIKDSTDAVVYGTTTHSSDIVLSNSAFYPANGILLGVSNTELSSYLDKAKYEITLIEENYLDSLTGKQLVGHTMELLLGFIDPSTGTPLTNVADVIVQYIGGVDSAAYIIDTSQIGSAVLKLTAASPMANLDSRQAFTLNRDSIRARTPSDASCDQIFEGSGSLILKWGKL